MVHFWLIRAIRETEPKTRRIKLMLSTEVLVVDWAKTRSQIAFRHFSSWPGSGGSPAGASALQNIVSDCCCRQGWTRGHHRPSLRALASDGIDASPSERRWATVAGPPWRQGRRLTCRPPLGASGAAMERYGPPPARESGGEGHGQAFRALRGLRAKERSTSKLATVDGSVPRQRG